MTGARRLWVVRIGCGTGAVQQGLAEPLPDHCSSGKEIPHFRGYLRGQTA